MKRGMLETGLLALAWMLAVLAFGAVSAAAATTVTVTTTADEKLSSTHATGVCETEHGGCALRAAVELADEEGGEYAIEVPEGKYTESLSPAALQIEGDTKVKIAGAGPEKTTIAGEWDDVVFEVFGGESSLTLDGVTVTGGEAEAAGDIFADEGASLVVEDSTITEGYSYEGGGGGAGDGGGVYAGEGTSVAIVDHSTIVNNYAVEGGGVDGGESIFGGDGASIVIKESTVTEDHAYYGGGVSLSPSASAAIERALISDNDSYGYGDYAEGYGGGVAADRGSAVRIDESTVSKNVAGEGGGGVAAGVNAEGCVPDGAHPAHAKSAVEGALAEPVEGLTIEKTAIEENSVEAGDGGGVGVYVVHEYCDDARPHTSGRRVRPALYEIAEGEYRIEQSTIAHNSTYVGESEYLPFYEQGEGGGVYDYGELDDPIVNSTIADNVAANAGGGVAVTGESFAALISDTVYDNSLEPPSEEEDAKARPNTIVDSEGAGDNLFTETGEDRDSDYESVIALRNTIVAEPEDSDRENCEGEFESLGYNLDFPSTSLPEKSSDTCDLGEASHDLTDTPPGFSTGELGKNGGPTLTLELAATSKAIGVVPLAGDCEESVDGPGLVDQRGDKRPGIEGDGCDIGAYEYQQPPVVKQQQNTTTTTTTPTTTPAPEAKQEVKGIKITSPVQCASKRDIIIHIQNVKQFGIVSAVVSIDGKHKRTLTGSRLKTAIDLIGLPKGTFTVEIVAHTASGQTLYGKRVYHTCHTKLPGHKHLRL